ncbi:MAG: CpsD/CapB family tyrosine-protein kinase [Clostridiales Family XIII bacterium]|jgi:capsular exopolysaccharide synthesis family protein|nr:CpsD/CapB family tyrosine-protein kinase [Clostridiales Family XIII bacterium]
MALRKKNTNKRTTVLNSSLSDDMKYRINEAYKVARTNIDFSILKKGCKKILFTSSLAGEGKSTTSVNTAISLSQKVDVKVLVIDCDIRKSKVQKFFNMDVTPGLTNYLSGQAKLEAIIRHTNSPNLDVITAGTTVPNPSEILASDQMSDLLTLLDPSYDYIIIDSPPLNVVIDALSLSVKVDGVVIVVKEGSSKEPELAKTIETLHRANAKVLGVILNGAAEDIGSSYKYSYYDKK